MAESEAVRLDLCGKWNLHNANKQYEVEAEVPGSMYTALQNARVINDPYYRYNDLEYRWIAWEDWTYTKTFNINSDIINKNCTKLVANGLDTISKIYINGKLVGESDNQFLRYVFDVKHSLREGENNISVCFESAPRWAGKQASKHPYPVPPPSQPYDQNPERHVNFIRKAQCSFAWDWGPAFPTQGIWQDIRIEAFNSGVLRDIVCSPSKDCNNWKMDVTIYADIHTITFSPLKSKVTIAIPELGISETAPVTQGKAHVQLSSDKAEAWWPHGYGEPRLYNLIVTLTSDKEIDKKVIKTGFRTVELVQDKMEEGYSFYYKWNGVPVFLKGSNWIPIDCFQERVTKQKMRELMEDAVAVNMNTARVWGGGIYQVDAFYELADEIGLIVWQDIMFGCSMYPADPQFLNNVRLEVGYQVRRLSRHPSILCWTGNNENEGALVNNWYKTTGPHYDQYVKDYQKLYIDTVKDEVLRQDPVRPFQISSPSNGPQSEESGGICTNPGPWSPNAGTVHYYNYEADCLDPNTYPRPRFAAEYGLQSWPNFNTVKKVSQPGDWYINGGFSLHRQHNMEAQHGMDINLARHFRLPESGDHIQDFKCYIYLTQILQALTYKVETEVYRRGQGDPKVKTMGAIYWQHNDIWQGPTWATIDYDGEWKMAHYYAAKFFSDVIVSAYEDEGYLAVYGVSDLTKDTNGFLKIEVWTWSSQESISAQTESVSVPSQTSVLLYRQPIESMLCGRAREECFVTLSLENDTGKPISPVSPWFPVSFKDVKGMMKPEITIATVEATDEEDLFSITVASRAVAAFVWLQVYGVKGRFSDNGFLLTKPQVKIMFYSRQKTTLEEVTERLEISSFADTCI